MNSRYRRLLKRLPDDVKSILDGLTSKYVVEDFRSQYMGWTLDLVIGVYHFNLTKEWRQVFVYRVEDGNTSQLWPVGGQPEVLEADCVVKVINELVS